MVFNVSTKRFYHVAVPILSKNVFTPESLQQSIKKLLSLIKIETNADAHVVFEELVTTMVSNIQNELGFFIVEVPLFVRAPLYHNRNSILFACTVSSHVVSMNNGALDFEENAYVICDGDVFNGFTRFFFEKSFEKTCDSFV